MKRKTPTTSKAPKGETAPLGMEAFMTRKRANEGTRIDLHTAEGTLSRHFLIVQGVDSDDFQKAKAKQARIMAELVSLPEAERDERSLDALCDLLAVLVKDWSFSNPELMPAGEVYECNPGTVSQFLREAPQIREKIDEIASRRSVFFRLQSAGLKTTPADSLT